MIGAKIAEKIRSGSLSNAKKYLKKINYLEDESIINACKLVSFDVWYRSLPSALMMERKEPNIPDKDTIYNIRVMVNRNIEFMKKYGPVIDEGFTFETDGYTDIVVSGDGDILTKDTLWDLKTNKKPPKSTDTLQILMYYIMGKHSKKGEFNDIKNIGIFNSRLNTIYILDTSTIEKDVIYEVEKDVICYDEKYLISLS